MYSAEQSDPKVFSIDLDGREEQFQVRAPLLFKKLLKTIDPNYKVDFQLRFFIAMDLEHITLKHADTKSLVHHISPQKAVLQLALFIKLGSVLQGAMIKLSNS